MDRRRLPAEEALCALKGIVLDLAPRFMISACFWAFFKIRFICHPILVQLASILERFSASWGGLGRSWRRLGPSWRPLGPSWRRLGDSWTDLGASWPILEASWAALGRF